MVTSARSWTVLDEAAGVLTCEYEFAPRANARAFATRFGDGELLVASPPSGVDVSNYQQLERFGKVTAILAPNGLHYLGAEPMLKAFPAAKIYAPAKAAARIAKKRPGLKLHALEELQARLGPNVEVVEVPGFKVGESWVKVRTPSELIWYVSDSCFSMRELPPALLPRLAFKWTKSAPGFRINRLGAKFFLTDKPGYKSWFTQQIAAAEPSMVVTAHGEVVRQAGLRETLNDMVRDQI